MLKFTLSLYSINERISQRENQATNSYFLIKIFVQIKISPNIEEGRLDISGNLGYTTLKPIERNKITEVLLR